MLLLPGRRDVCGGLAPLPRCNPRSAESKVEEKKVSRPLALMVMIVSMLGISPAESQPFAYITTEGSGTVSIIDTKTDKVTSTFNVGNNPTGIAASIDGARLYIGHQAGTLIERDLFEDKDSARTMLGGSVKAVRQSPKGKLLFVLLGDSNSVALIDMPTLRVLKTISIGGRNVEHAVFSPDGRWIYASAKDGDSVDVIDVAKGAIIKSIRVGRGPAGIAFLPDASRAYVAVAGSDEIVAIDVSRRAVVGRVKSPRRPEEVAAHPDGKRLFVSADNAGRVDVFDARSNTFVASVEVGAGPSHMAFTADGSKLYVASRLSKEVSVIDTSTYRRTASVALSAGPSAIVISDRPNLPHEW